MLPDIPVAITSFVLSWLLALPAISVSCFRPRASTRQTALNKEPYEDEDGSATTESEAQYSSRVQTLTILLGLVVGFLMCSALLIVEGVADAPRCLPNSPCRPRDGIILLSERWNLACWVSLLVQGILTFRTRSYLLKFRLGIYGSVTCLVVAVSIAAQAISWQTNTHVPRAHGPHYGLALGQLVLLVIAGVSFILIPRRPHVYLRGHPVDRQYTDSLLGRATYAWAAPILDYAAKHKNLHHGDLPVVSNEIRAHTLHARFDRTSNNSVWRGILWSNKAAIIEQWSLQAAQSFAQFLPQVVLFLTLTTLEARDQGQGDSFRLWLLVLALGLSDALANWLDAAMFYACYCKIGVPVYEQLATVIFGKAIIKKDVKGGAGSAHEEEQEGELRLNKQVGPKDEETAVLEDADADEAAKTKQSTLNLIGVDGKRIADFTIYNCMTLGAILKITIAIVLLVRLVGWIPMASGFAVFVALSPLNWWVTSTYTGAQDVLMKLRDQKMVVVTEALQGIRQIKFSALEQEWQAKIGKIRGKELKTQWRVFCFDTLLISIWIFGPVALSAVCLSVYALLNKTLSASVAFTTISIFESIEVTLAVVPELITDLFDALISARRLQEYLESPNKVDTLLDGEQITFTDAVVGWPSDVREANDPSFELKAPDLAFPAKELSIVSGKTGSGKSLLLAAIIGEAEVLRGQIIVPKAIPADQRHDHTAHRSNWCIDNAIAYVSQIPWIENGSIQENILFGLPLEPPRYADVLAAAALTKDLEMLEDGDQTDIGANGVNLSGGQKWRVSFARALYSRAGTLVLDDIFSAVDAHVGKHLYEQALTGPLGHGRTRILVTHHVSLCLAKTKYLVYLENGSVLQAGLTEKLRQEGLLKTILARDTEEKRNDVDESTVKTADTIDDGGSLQKILSTRSEHPPTESNGNVLKRVPSQDQNEPGKAYAPKKFTEEEHREQGAIKFTIYRAYIDACGGFGLWSFILFVFIIAIVIYISRSFWVSVWTRAFSTESLDHTVSLVSQQTRARIAVMRHKLRTVDVTKDLYYYLGVYLAIAVSSWIVGTLKYFFVYFASIRASKVLFEKMSYAVLRAPLRFLDTTPLGRILNRFTADYNAIDSKIAPEIGFSLHSLVTVVAVVVAGMFVSPLILIAAALLLTVTMWYALRYLAAAREIKRLESVAKSPVFEQFGSVLAGIGTIRAFGRAEAYVQRMYAKIDTHCRAYFHLWLFTRWMTFRIALVGSLFLTAMGVLIVSLPHIDASLAGFALSFSIQLSDSMAWMLRQYASLELDLNAVERAVEYANMPIEDQGGDDAPAAWPTKGAIEVDELVVSYAADLAPVLKGLSFNVKPNERVGVVGRTGAGKSSLTLALFRFLEARSGSVHIDGIDISKVKLSDLRSRLAIIPQDPVLFSGTIRSNLDAFDQHSDEELRDALSRVHLVSSTTASGSGSGTASPSQVPGQPSAAVSASNSGNINVFKSLQSKIAEGGLNLSQGQRQLLCLARAIVSRPKIMVLDEATSSVDMATDALIQRSIREEFADSTLLVIAHRLSTIADFDRILVLGDGRVLEFDTPARLMEKEAGVFRSMVEESGERRELEEIIRPVK